MAIKVGFVGSGGIAKAHMDSLQQIEDAEVVAFMDTDEERAVAAAARFPGSGAYTDLTRMLDAQELDTAYLCVPPHAHGEIELALIERDIPFFVEKPIANDRQTPARILKALQTRGLMAGAAYMSRYRASVARARQLLARETPVLARGSWIGGMPGVLWWRRKEMSGGQINEQTTHIFDLARYLFGEVASVNCVARTGLITDVKDYSVEDASLCTLVFHSGLLCEIASSCAVGAGGSVTLEAWCRESWMKLSGWDLGMETIKGNENLKVASTGENAFLLEDRAWIEAVKTGDASGVLSPYEDALKTQAVTCAANESIACGRPVAP